MSLNVLERADIAAQQRDWSLLNQCLQELLGKDSEKIPDAYLDQILNLALEVLEFGDFNERWEVAKILPKLGSIAIAPLISILEDEDAEQEARWFAGRLLGEFNDPSVITALVSLLQTSDDEDLTAIAAEALANLGSSTVESLATLLATEDTRLLAVRSLAQIRRSDTISPLLSVVEDPEVSVRTAAIEALGSFHDERIPPVLINALKDTAASVRKEAAIALGMRPDLVTKLDLVNQLKPLLFDLKQDVCQQAAIAIGRLKTDAAAMELFTVLRSPHTPTGLQLYIVRSLGWMGTPTALEYLQQALNENTLSAMSLEEIITILGRIEEPNLTPLAANILIKTINSEHPAIQTPSVKQALAMGLGQLAQSPAVSALIQMLADSDAGVRLHAIAALKKFPHVKERLELLADDDSLTPELKQGVAIARLEISNGD